MAPGTARGFPRSARRVAAVALGLALLGADGAAPNAPSAPSEGERPASGRFLVASEQIRGSVFHHSVVFLLSYAESGAIGLIVNHPTDLALSEVVQGAVDGAGWLHLGGPVELPMVMVLLRAQSPPKQAMHVAGDVFVTVDAALLLEQTGKPGSTGSVRVYAGYTGWGPGQLDAEIARGDWIVADAPVESIFDDAPEALWKKLHLRHHRLIAGLSAVPVLLLLVMLGCSGIEGARHYREGTQALERGDANSAVLALERAAERVPEASEVQNHLGLAYLASGRRDEALRAFERAVALDCDNSAASRNLALLRGDLRAP